MEPHRVLQETAYPSLAYGLFGLGRFLQQIPDSYKRVIFMSICGSIWLSLDMKPFCFCGTPRLPLKLDHQRSSLRGSFFLYAQKLHQVTKLFPVFDS